MDAGRLLVLEAGRKVATIRSESGQSAIAFSNGCIQSELIKLLANAETHEHPSMDRIMNRLEQTGWRVIKQMATVATRIERVIANHQKQKL